MKTKKCAIILGIALSIVGCNQPRDMEYAVVEHYGAPEFVFTAPVTEPAGRDPVVDRQPVTPLEPTIPTRKYGAYILDEDQQEVLLIAKKYGEEVGFPETIQSIAMQETLAGGYGDGIGDKANGYLRRSYGVMQVKIATARFVMTKFPELAHEYFNTDDQSEINSVTIRDKLINNDEFNVRMGSYNFALMSRYTNNWREAVVAYNTGLGGLREVENVDDHVYYKKIAHKLTSVIRPFNDQTQGDTTLLAMGD